MDLLAGCKSYTTALRSAAGVGVNSKVNKISIIGYIGHSIIIEGHLI